MRNWEALYQEKLGTTQEALSLIQSGDFIITPLGGSEPVTLLNQLHTVADRGVTGLDVSNCLTIANYAYFSNPDYSPHFKIAGWFYSPHLRAAAAAGFPHVQVMPQHLHSAFRKRDFARQEDGRRLVLLASCAPMDAHGYLSLSLGCTYERSAIDEGALVIAEVNPNLPRTFGDTTVHISEIAAITEVSGVPAPVIPIAPTSEKDVAIGNFIAERIEDGSTIQLGIGGIPNAVAAALKSRKHLGIHTEMFTDGMVDLIECGAVDNSQKTLYRHKSVATFALGTQRLYDYLHDNPAVVMRNGYWTNDPYIIGQNHKMVSINTTMEVDFFGQCASEAIGPVQFSGTGGQADTAIGAQRQGGRSFIALYSTANVKDASGNRTTISKITPFLKEGSIVSLSRNDVDCVVTEYGVASLQGRPVKDRVQRLIAIAHPDFRDQLLFEAKKHSFFY